MMCQPRWSPWPGDLVIIRPAVNYEGELPVFGIIIKCSNPFFGIRGEEFFDVLISGRIINVSERMIWPIEEEIKYEYVAQNWTYESVI